MKYIVLGLLLAIGTSAVHGEERTYPSFPDAMTERPAWLVNAPFDVDEYFKSPPAEQNAAPLYLDALFEFHSDMAICFCPAGEEPQGEVKRRAEAASKRFEEFLKSYRAYKKDPKSVDYDAVDIWLAKYETGFTKLVVAQKRPECVFERGMRITPPLPQAQAIRHVARVMKWRSRRDLARRKLNRPIQDVEILLRLTRDLQRRGGTLGQLVSIAADRMCYGDVILPILQTSDIKKEHCDSLLTSLDRHKITAQQRFLEAFKSEYLWTRTIMHNMQHRTGEFSEKPMKAMDGHKLTDSPLDDFRELLTIDPIMGINLLAIEKYGNDPTGLPSGHPFVAGWVVDGKLMTNEDYAKEITALNQFYASILKLACETHKWPIVLRQRTILEPLRATKVALFFEPYLEPTVRAMLYCETDLQATKCLIALRRWQIDHDEPPRSLRVAVRAAGMERVPIDPYSDKPMKMTILDGQPVVYSVGSDGKDDHARKECNFPKEDQTGDLMFRLATENNSH